MPATALLILDMQNDGLSEGGAFASAEGLEHARRQDVVANVRAVAAAARRAGVPVVHLHHVEEPGHAGTVTNTPLFRRLVERDGYVRGTWGAEPVPGLEPEPGDVVLEKRRMSAYSGTRLDETLRSLGVTELILCGVWTSFSVEHTAREAADRGATVVVVTDGTSTANEAWQRAALDYALTEIAERLPAREVVARLEAGSAGA